MMTTDEIRAGGPVSYLEPMAVRGRIARPHPRGLSPINLGYNELPYGPTPAVADALQAAIGQVNSYGTPFCDDLRVALGQANGLDPETIICGNGSEEILDVIARNFLRPGDELLISEFGYIQFAIAARRCGATLVKATETEYATDVDALLAAITDRTKLIFLANPNNPTGTVLPVAELARLAKGVPPHVVLVLDLAYGEFTGFDYCADVHRLAERFENVIVTRTFSKAYGLAGLRVGWAQAPRGMLPGFYAARGMGSVNRLAQVAALAALADIEQVRSRVATTIEQREEVARALAGMGISSLPSGTNFLLATIDGAGADRVEALVEFFFEDAAIIVNRTREAGLEHFLRFSMGLPDQNAQLIRSAEIFLGRNTD